MSCIIRRNNVWDVKLNWLEKVQRFKRNLKKLTRFVKGKIYKRIEN